MSWVAGSDSGLADQTRTSTVQFRLDPQADGSFAVRGATASKDALPIWLAGEIAVSKQSGDLVITVDGGETGRPVDAMTAAARAAVVEVLPAATADVVVVSPHTEAQMAQLVGRDVADITQIAAVTTNLDGSNGTAGATVILLNPAVFAAMDQRAAQVVLSHEATHLLTSAVGTSAETWVVEGFADFVALHDDEAPLSLSAGQILADVNAGGAPKTLPTSADFDSTGHGLGAIYESAWMIFRMLGETYGDAEIVGFYDDVLGGMPVERALDESFGLTTEQLTTNWQRYLVKSASTVS